MLIGPTSLTHMRQVSEHVRAMMVDRAARRALKENRSWLPWLIRWNASDQPPPMLSNIIHDIRMVWLRQRADDRLSGIGRPT